MAFGNNISNTKLTDFNMISCKLNYGNKIKLNQCYNQLNIEYTYYIQNYIVLDYGLWDIVFDQGRYEKTKHCDWLSTSS